MAISKERLKELIGQGATIYKISDSMATDYQLCSYNYLDDNDLIYENCLSTYWRCCIGKLDDLFETKEDAEFALKYKRIPKTEYLDLPTWEEFNKDNFGVRFYNKSREFCLHRVRYSASDKNPLWKIDLYESYGDDEDTVAWEKSWDLTKENYLEACELCRKLWLGEKDE